ncbi:MAG TPA: S8/S53 family peptidase [Acidimicrobiales bacterium]|nr:S8/S53 family peptidase [Acidimicrobiales bacterium]
MASVKEPTSQPRLRDLLARRRDIKVHPEDALDQEAPDESRPHHFYRPREVLVSNDPGQLESFERAAGQLGLGYVRTESRSRPRLRGKKSELASPLPAATRYLLEGEAPLEDTLCRLEDASHGDFEVTPNHVLFGSPVWGMDPYGEPRPPGPGDPDPQLGGGGAGVIVAVVDSGVPRGRDENPVLDGVETWPSEEEPWWYSGPEPILTGPQGHGSFVAGVVRQAAAQATVRSYRALDTDSVTDEWYLGHQLALVLAGGARVVNLSLGTTTRSDQTLMGLSALEAAAHQERHGHGPAAPIVVAAAGNLDSSRKVYPAADPWTISVGAVKLTGAKKANPERAKFSNFGGWVDVWARGVDVVSSYEAKPYRSSVTANGVVQFDGKAVWSGTSFAAPYISAKVAEILQGKPGLSRDEVLAELRNLSGSRKVPDLGWFVP